MVLSAAYWTNEEIIKYIDTLEVGVELKFLMTIKLTGMDFDKKQAHETFSKLNKDEIILLLRVEL